MTEIRDVSELDARIRKLIRRAVKVRKQAYAPYSGYSVGAAILDENGKIHGGCNVENASYIVLHAEVAAVGKMISRGGRSIAALVVAASEDVPAFPCGHCRQTLSEFVGEATNVYSVNGSGKVFRHVKFQDLIPHHFSSEQLKK